MIKKVFILAFIASFSLLIIFMVNSNYNDSNDKTFQRSESTLVLDDFSGVTMTIESVTDAQITVCINSDSDDSVVFGEDYVLEVKDGQKWHSLPVKEDIMFNSIGYGIKKGSKFQWSADFGILYGKLAPGQYRIIKGFRIEPQQDVNKEYFIGAEFSL